MARSNHDDFDGYRKWLGITNKKRLPTHYELLAISLDEDDPEVIQAAAEQRRHFVESKRGDGHDAIVTEILYRISEAETTLLNNEMRREYDRQRKLWEKRQKNRQIDPIASRSRVRSRPEPTVGEGTGFVSTFAGILGVFCVAIAIMTWFSFQLPWFESADQVEAAPIVQVPAPVAAPAQVAPVAVKPDLAKPQATEPVKTVVEDFATALNRGHIAIDGASGNGASSGFAIDAYLTNHHNIEVSLDISLKQPIFMRNRGRGQNMIVTKVYLHGGAYQSDGFRSFISLQPKVRTPVQFVAYCFDFEKDNPSKDEEFTRDALPNNLLPLLQSISKYDTLHPNEDVTVAGQVAIWLTQGVSIEDVRAKLGVNNAQETLAREFLDFEIVSPGQRATIADEITNSIGMKLKLIPAGEFLMGSPDNETGRAHETQHRVQLTTSYYLGVTEVTQGQWFAMMQTKPWSVKKFAKEGEDYPATNVSWDDAVEYSVKLSAAEGKTYRLPTEAEWEYACRGGKSTAYSFGNDSSQLSSYSWWGGVVGDGNAKTEQYAHKVGTKQSNPFGLHDMHGNVYEWCSDWDAYYDSSFAVDPSGPLTGSRRVFRGGSCFNKAVFCRSAFRRGDVPSSRDYALGFRLALSPSGK